jgi:hypothetical protein
MAVPQHTGLPCSLYSPDLTLSDFYLFLWMNWLKDFYFMDATEVQMAYKIVLQEVIHSGFQKINFL